jgi:uncharacterized protein Yka (UPF0111/DUF47 family)
MLEKSDAVAALGQMKLLAPARINAALAANDRLKFLLTVIQAAAAYAADTSAAPLDLRRDYAAARMDAPWLLDVAGSSWSEDGVLHVPELPRLCAMLREDITVMARPLENSDEAEHRGLLARTETWCEWLSRRDASGLSEKDLALLTGGKRGQEDTFHILVMDLHKALNRLSADLTSDMVDGAHVWQLAPEDRPRVAAFMRGLNRTRGLKFDHPGLETAATRDGARLLIQNDIGTNDAHVLVIQVEGLVITLTYSDLHDRRFAFFQALLAEIGANWSGVGSRNTAGLNAGADYVIGTARFDCADEPSLQTTLEELGARIVFLIDWNRARKRLNLLVKKSISVEVLTEAARREIGHMAWLLAGGERLVFAAMEALGPDYFRMGDQLDSVMGAEQARDFLVEALSLATTGLQAKQAPVQIEDQTRLLLSRHMARHRGEFAALEEHAAFCHALAEALRDALAHGHERDEAAAHKLADRAQGWERKADQMVIRLREEAARNPHRQPFLRLIESADDTADALEEAAFLFSLIGEGRHKGWTPEIRAALLRLAGQVLDATQDHVRALAIARTLGEDSTADDQAEFLTTCWRVVNAERACDALTRELRRLLVGQIEDAATLQLATDFAAALEESTDALLRTGYALRELVFARIGAGLQGGLA